MEKTEMMKRYEAENGKMPSGGTATLYKVPGFTKYKGRNSS